MRSYAYTYNESDGSVDKLDVTSGSISNKISYSYDGYGRITNKDIKTCSTSKVKQVYAYKTLSGTKTSLLVSNLTTYLSGAMSHAYAYTYDVLGNIETISIGGTLVQLVWDWMFMW